MIFSKTLCFLATSLLTLTLNSSALATPVVFEFTGTITDTVVDKMFGNETKVMSRTDWIGQQISGTVSLDFAYFGNDPNAAHTFLITYAADSEWMQVKLMNPDGTFFDSSFAVGGTSAPFDPYPSSAAANILHLYDDPYYGVPLSNLVLNRWYQDDNPALMYNYFELGLIGNGDNASLLVDSKNFEDVTVKPEFANLRNYGMVTQSHRTFADPSYYFLIDSFTRMETEVPEPSSPILMLSALLIVLLKRYAIFKRK